MADNSDYNFKEKIRKLLNHLYINKYGVTEPNHKNRWIYSNIKKALDDVLNTMSNSNLKQDTKIEVFTDVLSRVYDMHPNEMPAPGIFGHELKKVFQLKQKENTEPDKDFVEGHNRSIQKAQKRTEILENYGSEIMRKMEELYFFNNKEECYYEDGKLRPFALWFFYESLLRQDKDTLAILEMWKKK